MLRILLIPAAVAAVFAGCGNDELPEFTDDELTRLDMAAGLGAVPDDPTNAVADDPAAAHLGQFLFFDPRLSSTGTISCATCHDPELGFGDGKALAEGVGVTQRHTPTILNSAYNRWFFWDGRADSAWAQALGPMENPIEMGTTRLAVAHLIYGDPPLRAAYEAIFGEMPDLSDTTRFPPEGRPVEDSPDDPHHVAWSGMTPEDQDVINRVFANVGKAMAAYERKIVMVDAPFDVFVEGLLTDDEAKRAALSPEAQRGAQLAFGDRGACFNCHEGAQLADLEFQNIGLGHRDGLDPDDLGRYDGIPKVQADPFNGLGAYSDASDDSLAELELEFLARTDEQRGQFKTPSLRNVALTAPYMHGGHFETLAEVVDFYSDLDEEPAIGVRQNLLHVLDLDDRERSDLVAFLESLTGAPLDAGLTEQPATPAP